MTKSICSICEIVFYSSSKIERDGKTFCSDKCLEKYYSDRIAVLELSVKKWKKAWWEQRDIIGEHGVKIMRMEHPSYFKESTDEKG